MKTLEERKVEALEKIASELTDIHKCMTYKNGDTYNTIGEALSSLEDGNPKSMLGTLHSIKDCLQSISDALYVDVSEGDGKERLEIL